MADFKKIENISEILSFHYKSLLFLRLNKQVKLLISSMPTDIKYKLTQEGVMCDIYQKYNSYYFRIRVFHPSLAQDLRNDSSKKKILESIKLYKKYRPFDELIKKLDETEIIINHNKILSSFIEYKVSKQNPIVLKNLLCVNFNVIANDENHQKLIEKIIKIRKQTNAKIKSLSQN